MIADALSAFASRLRALSRVIPAECSQGPSWRIINLGTPHLHQYYEAWINTIMAISTEEMVCIAYGYDLSHIR
jgi:hypothetical protein